MLCVPPTPTTLLSTGSICVAVFLMAHPSVRDVASKPCIRDRLAHVHTVRVLHGDLDFDQQAIRPRPEKRYTWICIASDRGTREHGSKVVKRASKVQDPVVGW